jgi:hypothetical protein
MDLRLVTLKAVSFYLLHNVSTLNQCRKLSCGTVVCEHFASYQGYRNYRWDLIRQAKGYTILIASARYWDMENIWVIGLFVCKLGTLNVCSSAVAVCNLYCVWTFRPCMI